MIHWILAKGELLQIRIGFSEQADNKHARARGVQCGHSLDCLRLRVTRVDDDDWQRDDIHPNGLHGDGDIDIGWGNADSDKPHGSQNTSPFIEQQINRLPSDSYKAGLIVVWVLGGHTQLRQATPALMSPSHMSLAPATSCELFKTPWQMS